MNGSVLSEGFKRGAKGGNKMVYMIIAVASFALAVVGAIVKAIWFKVQHRYTSVMTQNGEVKKDKYGNPVVKESGWRCQMLLRDDHTDVNCTVRTSILSQQSLEAGDGKNDVSLSARYHVLSFRDGLQYRFHPARTLMIDDLNQAVEEAIRDAVRQVMANSKTAASKWSSKKLTKAVKKLIDEELDEMGVRLDKVMVPSASKSEAQVHGDKMVESAQLVKDGLLRTESIDLPNKEELDEFLEEARSEPYLAPVPS